MATRPTVTIEDIEDVVRSEAEERQQDNQEKTSESAEHPATEEAGSVLRSASTSLEVQTAKLVEPEKTVILHSWLGGKIVIKRVGTQLYLSLFK